MPIEVGCTVYWQAHIHPDEKLATVGVIADIQCAHAPLSTKRVL